MVLLTEFEHKSLHKNHTGKKTNIWDKVENIIVKARKAKQSKRNTSHRRGKDEDKHWAFWKTSF